MRDESGAKYLTVARLLELLATLPGESRVMTNAVGNLLVLTKDGEQEVGYIDFFGDGMVRTWVQLWVQGGTTE